jgi:hypothetical protein
MNGPLVSTCCNPLEQYAQWGSSSPKNIKKHQKNIVLLHRSAQLQVGPCRCSVQIFAEPPVQRACNAATQASLRWSSNGQEPAAPQPTSGKGTSSNQTCELQRHGSGCVSKMMRKKVNKNTLSLSVLMSSFSVLRMLFWEYFDIFVEYIGIPEFYLWFLCHRGVLDIGNR